MSSTRVERFLSQRSADNIVESCVEDVFRKYNQSGDGRMTREETIQFMRETYSEYADEGPGYQR